MFLLCVTDEQVYGCERNVNRTNSFANKCAENISVKAEPFPSIVSFN